MIAENDFLWNFDTMNQADQHTRILLVRVLRFAQTKIKKKSVSQSTQNDLKRIEMQKNIFYPFDP